MSKSEVKVVFRKFKDEGDIIALFPELPHDRLGDFCVSYQRVGQHGAAQPGLTDITVPATQGEYLPLYSELMQLGYILNVKERISPLMHDARRKAARKL